MRGFLASLAAQGRAVLVVGAQFMTAEYRRGLIRVTVAASPRRGRAPAAVLPITPWAGLGVLAAWADGALLLGGLLLRMRDA